MNSNVVRLPRERMSPVDREVSRLRREFAERPDLVTRQHLACQVHRYLADVEERHGKRSSALGYVIGGAHGTSRHRRRYEWEREREPDRDFTKDPLNKNAPSWMLVLERCAEQLGRDRSELILEAFTGSPLLPFEQPPAGISQEHWHRSLCELLEEVQASLAAQTDLPAALDYIEAACLEPGDDGHWTCGFEPASYRVDDRLTYYPAYLDVVPHVPVIRRIGMGLRFNARRRASPDWVELQALLDAAPDGGAPGPDEDVILWPELRYGLALVVDRSGAPRLSLFCWPEALLEVMGPGFEARAKGMTLVSTEGGRKAAAAFLGSAWLRREAGELGQLTFAHLGSSRFYRWSSVVFSIDGELSSYRDGFWDPLALPDEFDGVEFATSAPIATLGAMIERNLLYAAPNGVLNQRIDQVLLDDVRKLNSGLEAYRRQGARTAAAARQAFLQTLAMNGKSGEKSA